MTHLILDPLAGIAACSPSNNPNERNTLSIKGSKTEDGICAVGKELGKMLGDEFPKMIYILAMRNVGVARHILADKKSVVMKAASTIYKELLEYSCNINPTKDILQLTEYPNVTYMNTFDFIGTYITHDRIRLYEEALIGISSVEFMNQDQFVDSVQSLCKVNQIQDSNNNGWFRGNCAGFWKRGYCRHSAYCQYKEELVIHSLPIYST